jgi:hypothetical protein
MRLGALYNKFDELAARMQIYTVDTIGDSEFI